MFSGRNHKHWYKFLSNYEKQFLYSNPLVSKSLPLGEVKLASIYDSLKRQGHPVLHVIKNIAYKRKDWGTLIMLLSKISEETQDINLHLHQKAKKLANITEHIEVAYQLHKGVYYKQNKYEWTNTTPGNKVAILSGSWNLSRAHYLLAELRDPFVFQLMSLAIRDLTEAEFFGLRDTDNNPLPSRSSATVNDGGSHTSSSPSVSQTTLLPQLLEYNAAIQNWQERSKLSGATLLGYACKGTVMLMEEGDTIDDGQELQKHAYQFGEHFALASKAHAEYLSFKRSSDNSTVYVFDLTSAPVLIQLEHCPSMYDEIENCTEKQQKINFGKIFNEVLKGPGLKLTKDLIKYHIDEAKKHLKVFPKSRARSSLFNIISSIDPII